MENNGAFKGNKGEWSEVYIFLKLLNDGKISIADRNMNALKNVFLNIGVISVLVPLAPVLVHMYLPMGFIRLICTSVVSVLSVLTVVLAFGLKANERQYVYSYLKNKILNGK